MVSGGRWWVVAGGDRRQVAGGGWWQVGDGRWWVWVGELRCVAVLYLSSALIVAIILEQN